MPGRLEPRVVEIKWRKGTLADDFRLLRNDMETVKKLMEQLIKSHVEPLKKKITTSVIENDSEKDLEKENRKVITEDKDEDRSDLKVQPPLSISSSSKPSGYTPEITPKLTKIEVVEESPPPRRPLQSPTPLPPLPSPSLALLLSSFPLPSSYGTQGHKKVGRWNPGPVGVRKGNGEVNRAQF